MSVVIGIDVGGSTTKIVGFRETNGKRELIEPLFVKVNDPLTSVYGAFGKFTAENGLSLSSIDRVMMTGVGSSYLKNDLYGLPCVSVPEFRATGRGGLYLSGLSDALIVSMGTGTALVHATADGKTEYLGGTGVGGGTVVGLSRLLLNIDDVDHVIEMAESGDLGKVDLMISDITAANAESILDRDLTAANFGKISDFAAKEDLAAGILNLVFETVGMVAHFGAHTAGVRDVVVTGNLTRLPLFEKKVAQFCRMFENEGILFHIPPNSQFATVIGTALSGL